MPLALAVIFFSCSVTKSQLLLCSFINFDEKPRRSLSATSTTDTLDLTLEAEHSAEAR